MNQHIQLATKYRDILRKYQEATGKFPTYKERTEVISKVLREEQDNLYKQ